jgi:hypothetical protein
MAEKDQLVDQTIEQKDPYKAKGSDFPVKSVKAFTGQSGSKGEAEGQDVLVKQGGALLSPRELESVSKDGPSEWGKGGKAFSVGQNSGGGTSLDEPCGVDLASGELTCKGYKKTKVGEVPDPKLSIG